MKITPLSQFTLVNILFFGIVGSLLSGILPAIIFSLNGHELSSHLLHRNAEAIGIANDINYVIFSLAIGFLPLAISGYLYSKMYQNEFKETGAVDFSKEINFAVIATKKTIFWFYAFLAFPIVVLALIESNFNFTVLLAAFVVISFAFFLVWISAAIGAMVCANLISEWNEKQFDDL